MMKRLASLALLSLVAALPLASSLSAQRNPSGVTPVRPGQVRIVETYINANGLLVADTTLITVMPPAVATIELLNTFGSNGWMWNPNVSVGRPFCAYVIAKDAQGNILTGRPVSLKSLDTTVAQISVSQVCPDTSVDPAKLTSNPLPPLQLSLRKR